MEWQIIIALVIAIPIILIPVVFVWFLNIGGSYAAIKEARARRIASKRESGELTGAEQHVPVQTVRK